MNYDAIFLPGSNGRLCIYRSRVTYGQFDVVHLVSELDGHVLEHVKEDIWRAVDFRAATELNIRPSLPGASGRPLAENDDPRCSDWAEYS